MNLLLLYASLKWSPDKEGNVLKKEGGRHRQVQTPVWKSESVNKWKCEKQWKCEKKTVKVWKIWKCEKV